MKIGLVIGGLNSTGGAERVMSVLANELVRKGHETWLMVPATPKSCYPIDEAVHFYGTGIGGKLPVIRFFKKLLLLRKKIKQERPDAIISFMTPMNCILLLTVMGLGIPVYVSERVDPAVFKGTFTGFLRRMTYPLAKGIICQTEEAKAFFKGKLLKKCCVIPNPLTKTLQQKTEYTASKRICAVGRLTSQKNYPLMIRAFSDFVKEYPDYTLEIYGKGEAEPQLQSLIGELSLEGRVLLKGTVSDIDTHIVPCDFFVMSSDFEGLSNALMEAMSCGLPCAATDCRGGGASFLIDNETNGLLLPIGDEQALATAMKRLAADESLRRRLGEEATEIRRRLSVESVVDRWVEAIQQG